MGRQSPVRGEPVISAKAVSCGRPGEDGAFAPLLICTNLQTAPSHAEQAGDDALMALDRCAVLLGYWRERRWPVAHLRRIAQLSWFEPHERRPDWIEGF